MFFNKHPGLNYVNRPDIAEPDWILKDFTIDSEWHLLDCSAILPPGEHLVHLYLGVKNSISTIAFYVGKPGTQYHLNVAAAETQSDNVYNLVTDTSVICSKDGKLQYLAVNVGTWAKIDMFIRGWWI